MTHLTPDDPCICEGEGFTDDHPDPSERAPWSFWTSDPGAQMSVQLGLIHRIACTECAPAAVTE